MNAGISFHKNYDVTSYFTALHVNELYKVLGKGNIFADLSLRIKKYVGCLLCFGKICNWCISYKARKGLQSKLHF